MIHPLIEPVPFEGKVAFYIQDYLEDCTPVRHGKALPFGNFQVNVLTVDRAHLGANQHVHQTLASMNLGGYTGPIHLFVGQGPTEYLDQIRGHKRLAIHQYDCEFIKPHANLVLNWLRSIDSLDKHYLFLEDDVICVDGWHEKLTENIHQLFDLGIDQFLLSLDRPSHIGYTRTTVAGGSKAAYTGTFGIFLTAKAIRAMYPHILGEFKVWEENQDKYEIALDMSMKYAMIRSFTKLYHCDPALVKHIGHICSLTGGKTITTGVSTESFGKNNPELKVVTPKPLRRRLV